MGGPLVLPGLLPDYLLDLLVRALLLLLFPLLGPLLKLLLLQDLADLVCAHTLKSLLHLLLTLFFVWNLLFCRSLLLYLDHLLFQFLGHFLNAFTLEFGLVQFLTFVYIGYVLLFFVRLNVFTLL